MFSRISWNFIVFLAVYIFPYFHFGRRFNINWTAPLAEGSFRDARGDINISHDYFIVNSSSVAFELFSKMQTSYSDENMLDEEAFDAKRTPSCTIDGVELDLHMRGFEFLSLVSYIFESPRPTHLKATGRVKFVGKVLRPSASNSSQDFNTEKSNQQVQTIGDENKNSLAGEVSISGLKLNQLILAPKLAGQLSMTRESIKVLSEVLSCRKKNILVFFLKLTCEFIYLFCLFKYLCVRYLLKFSNTIALVYGLASIGLCFWI